MSSSSNTQCLKSKHQLLQFAAASSAQMQAPFPRTSSSDFRVKYFRWSPPCEQPSLASPSANSKSWHLYVDGFPSRTLEGKFLTNPAGAIPQRLIHYPVSHNHALSNKVWITLWRSGTSSDTLSVLRVGLLLGPYSHYFCTLCTLVFTSKSLIISILSR